MVKGQTVDIIKMYIYIVVMAATVRVSLCKCTNHVCENLPVTVHAYPYLHRHSNEGY